MTYTKYHIMYQGITINFFIIISLLWYSALCIHRCNYKIKDSQFHENSICVLLIFSSMEKQISILHCWWGHNMENFSAFQWVPFRKGPLCRYWCLCGVSPNELLNKYSSGRRSRDVTVIAWYIPTDPQLPNKKSEIFRRDGADNAHGSRF